ncbi:MAG TPA: MBL fold metallo-hydrolase, partial [Steroidobacteraceae bacterium]|nr:MBL fold metallo-hydrolase [Steroidobacteraceae bacterium]
QPGRPIVRDPTAVTEADVLLVESTYGNRNHRPLADTLEELVGCINDALREHQGVVLVPAFAVGRTQEFLYFLNQLTSEGRIAPPAVFVDSPMAAEISRITAQHFDLFDEEARTAARDPLRVTYTQTVPESMALNRIAHGAIIVAASGMCDGGRIRHHLRHRLPDSRTTVLIVGFQAAGTLGRRLVDGARMVRISGEEIPVRARIVTLGGFSAHADQTALLDWLGHLRAPPRRVFLVHGEAGTMQAFAAAIDDRFGWRSEIPAHGETVTL